MIHLISIINWWISGLNAIPSKMNYKPCCHYIGLCREPRHRYDQHVFLTPVRPASKSFAGPYTPRLSITVDAAPGETDSHQDGDGQRITYDCNSMHEPRIVSGTCCESRFLLCMGPPTPDSSQRDRGRLLCAPGPDARKAGPLVHGGIGALALHIVCARVLREERAPRGVSATSRPSPCLAAVRHRREPRRAPTPSPLQQASHRAVPMAARSLSLGLLRCR